MPKDFRYISKRRKNQLSSELARAAIASCISSSGFDNNESRSESVPPLPESSRSSVSDISENTVEELTSAEHDETNSNHSDADTILNHSDSLSDMSQRIVSDDITINEEKSSLRQDLQNLIVECNVPHNTVNRLLKLLRKHGHDDLPKSGRSLMKTPRNISSKIQNLSCGGQYIHFGLASELQYSVKKYSVLPPKELKLNINCDGLPLSRSSGSQFWPIMGSIESFDCHTEPFVIGVFHGMYKPGDANEFLTPFVDEMENVLQQGIFIDGCNKCKVTINAILCDAPAKSFIKYTKGHSGYFSCSKCTQEGDYVKHRVTYPDLNSVPRSDQSFKNRTQDEHHTGDSRLEDLDIGMVSRIPLDYMHLVCLGVMKRLLQFWTKARVKGSKDVKFPKETIEEMSKLLIQMGTSITPEFARMPRDFDSLDNWKATEFRQFLLYTGPVLLKSFMSKEYYDHFLSLSIAIRILADPETCVSGLDYAQWLLLDFVSKYGELYGEEYISHNVHNLIHLPDDVRLFGCLDNFSCFKFENEMQKIKNKIHNCGKPLQEFANRVLEKNHLPILTSSTHRHYPIIHYKADTNSIKSISELQYKTFTISEKEKNRYCLLEDNSLAQVIGVFEENNVLRISVKCFSNTESLYSHPCESTKLGIAVISPLTLFESKIISPAQIKKKCMKLECPNEIETYVIIPLLHVNN